MKTFILYVSCELISLIFMYLGIKGKKYNKAFLVISSLFLILIVGFRSLDTGTDTYRYAEALNRYVAGYVTQSDKIWLGKGYFFIFYIIKYLFGSSYVIFNLLIAFLTIYFLYRVILKESQDPLLSLFLFFATCLFLQMLNQSRQLLAIVLVLYSYSFVKEKKLIKYVLVITIAGLIHSSALIMLPFYYLGNLKINKKTILSYMLVVLLILFGFPFIERMMSYTTYGQVYVVNNYMTESQSSSFLNLAVRFLLLLFILFLKEKDELKNNSYFFNMAIWTLLTQLITTKIYIFGRITTYFFVYYLLSIPYVLEGLKNRNNKLFYYFVTVLIFTAYYIVYYKKVSISSGYSIYNFFWK
ncbi:EpsG family protein [Streptococcus equinus]|uniref:EpsG family protein n=1 Tax=Streptococcus equinus TaxID=1335 RepID=UPI0009448CE4|nr:EpsG family protein [Streptococcus equinus]